VRALLDELVRDRRALPVRIAGEQRFAAVEDVARLRDALGLPPPPGMPQALLQPVPDALADLVSRYARTHGPFHVEEAAARLGLGVAPVRAALERLAAQDRVLEGEFLPGGRGREWCDAQVVRTLKQRSLARLRKQVEPVEPGALGRFLLEWQGLARPRQGLDALLASIEALQGAPVPASALEREVLAARVHPLRPGDLDVLTASGEVVWMGVEPIGPRDGRVALFLADHFALLAPPARAVEGALAAKVRGVLATRGASFFADLLVATGAFPADLLKALWDLVWAGEVTNDTLAPLRSYLHGPAHTEHPRERRQRHPFAAPGTPFRSRRAGPPGSEGRWSLLPRPDPGPSPTERAAALAQALLSRYGIVTREAVQAEGVAGGFSSVYPVLRAMEEAGRARRGYFVAGLGGAQFAQPGAEERLRALREPADEPHTLLLAATDPANPYGALLPWPGAEKEGDSAPTGRPQRASGASVALHDGELIAWLGRGENSLLTFLPEQEPARSACAHAVARALASLVESRHRRVLLLASIDGTDPAHSALAPELRAAGFLPGSQGWLKRAPLGAPEPVEEPAPEDEPDSKPP
jgi:ATP-dependent Lhr-like helicase